MVIEEQHLVKMLVTTMMPSGKLRHRFLSGTGLKDPIGHIDFYPNGGDRQPNCSRADVLCEHLRSYDYYLETIIPGGACSMVGFVCSDWDAFRQGRCADCGPRNDLCLPFGEAAAEYGVFKERTKSLTVFFATGGYYPYCVFHYQVRLEVITDLAGRRQAQNTTLTLAIGPKVTLEIALKASPAYKSLVQSYTKLVTSLKPLDGIAEVTVSKKADMTSLESLINFVYVKPMNYASHREQLLRSKLFCPVGNTIVQNLVSVLKLAACTSA